VDDVELRDWNIDEYRHNLALVLQEVQLFHDTIRNNITLWDDASDEELEEILKIVNADFVMNLPGGLDYMLAPEGANLSQGQRQLIAFARLCTINRNSFYLMKRLQTSILILNA